MPRFDGTGPNGAGRRTGRGLGSCLQGQCNNYEFKGGCRNINRCHQAQSLEEQLRQLKEKKDAIEAEIACLEKRLH